MKPFAERVRYGKHHFVAAFLQLGGELDYEVWNNSALLEQVNFWKAHRCKQMGHEVYNEGVDFKVLSKPVTENCSLIVVEWS